MTYFVTNTNSKKHYTEGDVWEENGKTWTISNGIKKSVGKLHYFRKQMVMPLSCPNCNKAMKSQVHKPMWQVYKMCLNCVLDVEHEIRKQGKWLEYQEHLIKANMQSKFKDVEAFVNEFIKESGANSYVTEDGAVEHWVDNTKQLAQKVGSELIENFKQEVDKLDK